MVTAMLMVNNPDSDNFEGRGEHKFFVPPRVGDHIELGVAEGEEEDANEIAYLYKVISVHHPNSPVGTRGDIFAVQVGLTADVIAGYLTENQ